MPTMSAETPRQRLRISTVIGQLDALALDLPEGTSYHELSEYLKNHELIPLIEAQALGLSAGGATTPGMHDALLLRRDQVVLVELLEPRDETA